MARSAGLLLFRLAGTKLEVLLVHPGGPFWAKKDEGAWSVPKGELDDREEPLAAAKREFEEELGTVPDGDFVPLQPVRQAGGKIVLAWALEADFDVSTMKSNTFRMEWPPRSGKMQDFPEVDRAGWFAIADARRKLLAGQISLLDELERHTRSRRG
ncbi:MAG: NUDIX domain-containing protein [Bacteroidales bacterium]